MSSTPATKISHLRRNFSQWDTHDAFQPFSGLVQTFGTSVSLFLNISGYMTTNLRDSSSIDGIKRTLLIFWTCRLTGARFEVPGYSEGEIMNIRRTLRGESGRLCPEWVPYLSISSCAFPMVRMWEDDGVRELIEHLDFSLHRRLCYTDQHRSWIHYFLPGYGVGERYGAHPYPPIARFLSGLAYYLLPERITPASRYAWATNLSAGYAGRTI